VIYGDNYDSPIMIRMKQITIFAWVAVVTIWAAGCESPMSTPAEDKLREQLLASNQAYLEAAASGPVIEISRPPSDVNTALTDERRDQLDHMSGPQAYKGHSLILGPDLLGRDQLETVSMSLEQVIGLAAEKNLDVRFARITPAVSQAQITEAEANFDAVFFTNLNFRKLDTPLPPAAANLGTFGSVKEDTRELTTGIRKNLVSGGQMTISARAARNRRNPSFFDPVKTWYDGDISLTLNQPLLRNFGADVSRAQIMLAANARREAVEDLKRQLLDTLFNTEAAYWNLVFARHQLLIQARLLTRTIEDRDQLKQRENFDVSPVRLTEANSFVELRRADVIRARQQLRIASDRLKQLIYSHDLPLAGEALIIPLDSPVDLPLKFSLLDAVSTALRHRPELQRALHEINDASIRQRVADNQRLPLLDLAATLRYNGTSTSKGGDLGDAYSNLTDGDFIDYLISAQFEIPIGNRGPEALFRQQQLRRRAAVVNYQRNAEQVVLEVKEALRNLYTTFQLIDAARAARRAASDNLRAIEEQEEAGVALTPEFLLDLKLSTQQRLANAEVQEIQAMTDYNTAIASFYRAMGTLLERNKIEFADYQAMP